MENSENSLPNVVKNFHRELTVIAPGRINFFGEHTAHHNGYVLTTAIDKSIKLHFEVSNNSSTCNVYTKTYNKLLSFDLQKIARSEHTWENYILGVVNEIQKRGVNFGGFNCIIESNLPVGAGVGSSAALGSGMAFGINELFGLGLSRQTIAELSRHAETNYVEPTWDAFDQYASVLSKQGHLLLLDCRSLEATYIPAVFTGHKFLLLNPMLSHNLASGEYNTRRQECEDAISMINKRYPEVNSLRDLDLKRLQEFKNELPDVLYRRTLYVVSENDRVLNAVEAIKKGDLEHFGLLMYASHNGLRDNYEISSKELDFLVDITQDHKAVKGARMVGLGFDKCTVNLIEEEAVDDFVQLASQAYYNEFKIQPKAFVFSPEQGTHLIKS